MCTAGETGSGIVESHMAGTTDTHQPEVDTAGFVDRVIITGGFVLFILGQTVGEMSNLEVGCSRNKVGFSFLGWWRYVEQEIEKNHPIF